MYIFSTCHPKAHLVQGYPPVVPTAKCRLYGEKVRLTPIEVLTNHAELESGSYACPLCRRLMAEAESSIPDGQDPCTGIITPVLFSISRKDMPGLSPQAHPAQPQMMKISQILRSPERRS